jgi:glutamate synthase (NADPH/NADH) small chain
MGKPTGFLEIERVAQPERAPHERRRDFDPVHLPMEDAAAREQGARCMACGVPFCHASCPLSNLIPEWNDLVYRDDWRAACERLHTTNNFPEVTGLVCPAPCEASCVVSIHGRAVSIKTIELAIAERGWREGWIRPLPPAHETGHRVAVVGSGPAGLAAAQQLRRLGHQVVVFEKDDRAGGLLRYGIPRFKLPGEILDRRIDQLTAEGVEWRFGVQAGSNPSLDQLRAEYEAVVLACGANRPRDLPVPGRDLGGVHLAMVYLTQQTRLLAGDEIPAAERISARDKRVIVIGGGDTGADCVATALRQGASRVVQLEILERPPDARTPGNPWPEWPRIYRVSYALQEGGEQQFAVATTEFVGNGRVSGLRGQRVRWRGDPPSMEELGDELEIEADLVILAMGFVGTAPVHPELALNARGNIPADERGVTGLPGVFACGDARRGQSLVVQAIQEGRTVAGAVDAFLME